MDTRTVFWGQSEFWEAELGGFNKIRDLKNPWRQFPTLMTKVSLTDHELSHKYTLWSVKMFITAKIYVFKHRYLRGKTFISPTSWSRSEKTASLGLMEVQQSWLAHPSVSAVPIRAIGPQWTPPWWHYSRGAPPRWSDQTWQSSHVASTAAFLLPQLIWFAIRP